MKFERENPQLVRRRADLRASVARVLMMATASTAILYFPQAALAEGNCPVGQRPSGAEKVTNSTIDPALGYAAMGADANMFKADVGTYPADGNGGAFPNTGIGILTGTHNDGGFINQPAFPGDATPPGGGAAISAQANWLGYNGNDAGAPTKLWEQTVTGLTAGKAYAFTAYLSNALVPTTQDEHVAPKVSFRAGGTGSRRARGLRLWQRCRFRYAILRD